MDLIRYKLDHIKVPDISNPGKRKLIPSQIEAYRRLLEKQPPIIQQLADLILNNTVYIDDQTLQTQLGDSLAQFLRLNPNLKNACISLKLDKPGSDVWLLAKYWPYLSQYNICTDNLSDVDHVILLDDVLYSGVRIVSEIDNIVYEIRQLNPNAKIPTFHVISAYTCPPALDSVNTFQLDSKVLIHQYSHILNVVIPSSELIKVGYSNIDAERLLLSYFGSEGQAVPVYLDHSVGKEQSSFPGIYLEGKLGDQQVGPLIPAIDRDPINYVYQTLTQHMS